jgi:hypothetical protein
MRVWQGWSTQSANHQRGNQASESITSKDSKGSQAGQSITSKDRRGFDRASFIAKPMIIKTQGVYRGRQKGYLLDIQKLKVL